MPSILPRGLEKDVVGCLRARAFCPSCIKNIKKKKILPFPQYLFCVDLYHKKLEHYNFQNLPAITMIKLSLVDERHSLCVW